jgi:thymidylate synthase (FAD)
MQIIKPYHEILDGLDAEQIMKKIEVCGRVAYKSEDKITQGSAEKFVRNLVDRGHESVIEHISISVKFVCDRGVTHELVRHRLASYTQESTRYCNYSKLGVTFIEPPWGLSEMDKLILSQMEEYYNTKIKLGQTPQQARYWLPNGLKTEIIATTNLREWRHILKLRTAPAAHPQMRELMLPLLAEFKEKLPAIFGDINEK